MTRSGYLISVSSENSDSSEAVPDAVTSLISKGFYATLFSEKWNSSIPSTLGDYLTMKAGDNVYFMCKRIIYGIGEIVQMFPGDAIASFELQDGATTTKYHPDSCLTTTAKAQGNETKTKVMRWGIIFKASPYFFKTGVDMDDMLASNPSAFRSLRTFWKKRLFSSMKLRTARFAARLSATTRACYFAPRQATPSSPAENQMESRYCPAVVRSRFSSARFSPARGHQKERFGMKCS